MDLYCLDYGFTRDLCSILQSYCADAYSRGQTLISFYTGSIILVGCIGFFVSRAYGLKTKLKVGVFLFSATSMLCYYQPLIFLYSLLKNAESYWCRYSYVCSFACIFVAAMYFAKINEKDSIKVLINTVIIVAILFVLNKYHPLWEDYDMKVTCFLLIVIGILQFLVEKTGGYGVGVSVKSKICCLVLFAAVILELGNTAEDFLYENRWENVEWFETYVENQMEMIEQLNLYDSASYRISETSTRSNTTDETDPQMNESLTYNYWSVSAYTSSVDGAQLSFMDRMGYKNESDRVSIVRAPVISTDSLLGVKYILSGYNIEGLELLEKLGTYNGKSVYYNLYALPMSIVYKANDDVGDSDAIELYDNPLEYYEYKNTFTYQNRVFSRLLGEDVEIYVPIENVENIEVDKNTRRYDFELPGENYLCYINFPFGSGADISLNDIADIEYYNWLTPSVLYVHKKDKETKISVEVSSYDIDSYIYIYI